MIGFRKNNEFEKLIKACIKQNRQAQKKLYMEYYSYSMSICIRYSDSKESAAEIMNDGFMKIFKHLKSFDISQPFKPWLRKIMINCSLDYLKKNELNHELHSLKSAEEISEQNSHFDQIAYEELLTLVQNLPPAYRTVFNLYAIEGYKHEEIAQQLNISIGTSKSNFHKAKAKLQESLQTYFDVK